MKVQQTKCNSKTIRTKAKQPWRRSIQPKTQITHFIYRLFTLFLPLIIYMRSWPFLWYNATLFYYLLWSVLDCYIIRYVKWTSLPSFKTTSRCSSVTSSPRTGKNSSKPNSLCPRTGRYSTFSCIPSPIRKNNSLVSLGLLSLTALFSWIPRPLDNSTL